MITYKTGNLLESKAQVLVNTVNCVGVMGKGIALQFKEKFPLMFEQYKKVCGTLLTKGGDIWWYRMGVSDHYILCFATKQHWKFKSKIEWIEYGLKSFVAEYKQLKIKSVAFPKLGCNNGGLDWETQVKPLMEKYLGNLKIEVEIYV